ncbi:MAG: DUF1501 domain-containing protein [Vicinamibacterales bacterium]|jgi:hypothetical protein|nr:DUF1501 domain-containing protein [Vicinamibacterales bacterium]
MPITRRDALKAGIIGSAGLFFADRLGSRLAAAAPTGRAKAVIQIWMWGGPSHIDTFDPKPDAGYDYCGPLAKAIPTNADGIQVGELLPLLAKQADKFSIIRSMTHGINAHETASYAVQTGRNPGDRLVYPGAGAIVSLLRGYNAGYTGLIPPYIVLTELQGRFSESGFLGPRYAPFATGGDPAQTPFAVQGVITPGITEERQRSRRDLLRALNTLGGAVKGSASLEAFAKAEDQAYELILGESGKVFDLAQESDEMRERYGKNTFGQSCLAARRLVERGVPYITINYKGWDTHKQHFQIMRQRLPQLDKGFAALLQDLSERGLLDGTIVWWGGEFGRTPRVQWEAPWNGGRGHWGSAFSTVLAGGGFKGGRVVGASDARGEEVKDHPVSPADVIGSIFSQLGLDLDAKLPNPDGLDLRIAPAAPGGAPEAGPLKEIM